MQKFAFGGNTGMTYDQIQSRRALADQMALSMRHPRDVGEGLSAIGRALAVRGMRKSANAADQKNKQEFDSKFGGFGDIGPTTGTFAASGGTVGAPPEGTRDLLAKTIMAEAGGESYEGMLATGAVMRNRVNAGGYGGNLDEVIMKPGQFSAWNGVTGYANGEGGLDMANIRPSQDAYRAADAILSGNYSDPTGGATHYYNPSVANPRWGARNGGQWQTIGNHIFGNADAGRSQQSPAALMEIAGSQYASAGQRALAQQMLEQQQKASDPLYQMQLRKNQLELERLQNPQIDPMDAINLEKAQLELEQMKNPQSDPMQELKLQQAQVDLDKSRAELAELDSALEADPKDLADFRKEFSQLSPVKEFSKQSEAFGRVVASAKDPSPAGDLALIFNYMKVLDPGSVVRESEFATAAASGSYGERIKAAVGRVNKGERLSDVMRDDFVKRAEALYDQAEMGFSKIYDQYSERADRLGYSRDDVMNDFRMQTREAPSTSTRPQVRGGVQDPQAAEVESGWRGPTAKEVRAMDPMQRAAMLSAFNLKDVPDDILDVLIEAEESAR